MYTLSWTNPGLPGKADISVPVASAVSTAASLTFTGKGAANYGAIQQTNLMRLLENFADGAPPSFPTIGQTWFDSTTGTLNVCTNISPVTWEALGGLQVTTATPVNPAIGDLWFYPNSHSGFLYVYTGTGRYPAIDWDAHASGFFPAVSPLVSPFMGVKLNYSDFSTPNFGEAYIHGFSGAVPADVDGTINGIPGIVPRGVMTTDLPNSGYIVYDSTATLVSYTAISHFFSVRSVGDNRWEYDNDRTWVPFTPAPGMYVIGFITVAQADTDVAPGISYAEIWRDALDFGNPALQAVPLAQPASAAGGWHQLWPTIEYHGARFEYDTMLARLLQLIGSPFTFGGNSAAVGLQLTDLDIVDASITSRVYDLNRDPNVGPVNDSTFVAGEPTSDDWDRLLAAARWALNRLDLPVTMVDSVSRVPFTQDGRVVSGALSGLPTTDIRYPTPERLTMRRWGSITGARLYAETMNALNAAIAQRYTMKGIAGQNSTITSLSVNVATTNHCGFTAAYTGGGATFNVVHYRSSTNEEGLATLLASGAAIDLKLDYLLPGVPTADDLLFKSFIDTNNTLRITADAVRVFGNSLPLSLSIPPVAGGFNGAGDALFNTVITLSSGASSIALALARYPNELAVRLSLTGPAGISGTTTLNQMVLRDTQTYGLDVPFFPPVADFNSGTDIGGTDPVWVLAGAGAPPVVDFSADVTSGIEPLTVTFTYTGTGSPTLIEWDFTGDGIYDATGNVAGHTYPSAGTYTVRCRATNPGGQNILTRPSFITVNPVAPIVGEQIFTSSGTFTVPAGVFFVSAVAVGQGGSGAQTGMASEKGGGGGGGLGWRNNIPVTPGQNISVIVNQAVTGNSEFTVGMLSTIGYGGGNQSYGAGGAGGGFVGEGGGYGGAGGTSITFYNGGGGGAGGYSGSGGSGGTGAVGSPSGAPASGVGGAGAGGGAASGAITVGGGGVGILGSNGSDSGVAVGYGGQGGAGGGQGTYAVGGLGGAYGGGAGGGAGAGASGAVRIIWGPGRSFPGSAS